MAGLSILLIDDDPEFLELVECNLSVNGFSISKATNGPDGLKLARKGFSVILLDRTMPEMDGMEVLKQLKSDRKTRKIPVFMLTGLSKVGEVDEAFEAGADDYIGKPIELMKLAATIKLKLKKLGK